MRSKTMEEKNPRNYLTKIRDIEIHIVRFLKYFQIEFILINRLYLSVIGNYATKDFTYIYVYMISALIFLTEHFLPHFKKYLPSIYSPPDLCPPNLLYGAPNTELYICKCSKISHYCIFSL